MSVITPPPHTHTHPPITHVGIQGAAARSALGGIKLRGIYSRQGGVSGKRKRGDPGGRDEAGCCAKLGLGALIADRTPSTKHQARDSDFISHIPLGIGIIRKNFGWWASAGVQARPGQAPNPANRKQESVGLEPAPSTQHQHPTAHNKAESRVVCSERGRPLRP
jgi:hypothetical protein